MSLSLKLREGTSQNHSQAESARFIRCFMKGVFERESYSKLLEAFYFIYSALENELEKHKSDSILSNIYFPALYRKESIEKDLSFFKCKSWKDKLSESRATQNYVNRIKEVSQDKSYLLVAHSYVRYLGDLSGGQILKKIAAKAMDIGEKGGLDFYEFPELKSPNEFKKSYREALDKLPISSIQEDEVLEEAKSVFNMNQSIFLELEEVLIQNIGREKFESTLQIT
jgi:heme oxygenase (biliverdin-producing, ferredoxin)